MFGRDRLPELQHRSSLSEMLPWLSTHGDFAAAAGPRHRTTATSAATSSSSPAWQPAGGRATSSSSSSDRAGRQGTSPTGRMQMLPAPRHFMA